MMFVVKFLTFVVLVLSVLMVESLHLQGLILASTFFVLVLYMSFVSESYWFVMMSFNF